MKPHYELTIPFTLVFLTVAVDKGYSIFCYKCTSRRDFRCLDPFDYQPHVSVNCDFEAFVRDRKPVFCEKTTELIDGIYVTTRGCSTKQWEDIDLYFDQRNQDLRCFRRGAEEKCLCTTYNCNRGKSTSSSLGIILSSLLAMGFLAPWA